MAVGAAATLGAACFATGFGAFVLSLDRSERDPAGRADAIVALTGGHGRIEEALDLLARGYGKRLLITGVNPVTSREDIKRLGPGLQHVVQCCVDLDYRATNTVENAAEITRWVRDNGFRSLIVVTSYYHLPRTLAELDETLPDVSKTSYAVMGSTPDDDWGQTRGRIRTLFSEYVKFLVVSVRTRAVDRWTTGARTAASRQPRPSVAEKPRAS